MAITMRRGSDANFDPTKLVPGEFAVLNTTKKIAVAFADGTVKNMQTEEDAVAYVEQTENSASSATSSASAAATSATNAADSASSAYSSASYAYDYFHNASLSATSASSSASIATEKATAVATSETNINNMFKEVVGSFEIDSGTNHLRIRVPEWTSVSELPFIVSANEDYTLPSSEGMVQSSADLFLNDEEYAYGDHLEFPSTEVTVLKDGLIEISHMESMGVPYYKITNTNMNNITVPYKECIAKATEASNYADNASTSATEAAESATIASEAGDTKMTELESRFTALTATQQQDAEVIDARKGMPSLKAKIDNIDSGLAVKADKSEVTNVMTPKGNIAYASLPTTGNEIGWYYYCLDGDGTNGAGNYVWNGTAWYFGGTGDEGYNIVNNKMISIQSDSKKIQDSVLSGGYINYQTGVRTTTTDGNYKQTGLIEIPLGCKKIVHNYITNTLGIGGWAAFGVRSNYLFGGIGNVITDIQNTWKYISFTSYDESKLHLNKYIEFYLSDSFLNNNYESIKLYPDLALGYVSMENGSLQSYNENGCYKRTEYYIPIPKGTVAIHHNFINKGTNGWCIYNSSKTMLRVGITKTITDFTSDQYFITLSDYDYQAIHDGKYIEFYIGNINKLKADKKFLTKQIGFIGDSITFGLDPDNVSNLQLPNGWVEQVCEKLECIDALNYGISSSTVCPIPGQSDLVRNPMVSRYANMDDSLSIVGVLGGINDAFNNVPLGTMNDRTSDTFYGGLHILFKGLARKYQKKDGKHAFVITYPRYDYLAQIRTDVTFDEWMDAVRNVANYYSLPICDLHKNLGASPEMDDDFEYWRQFNTYYHNPHPTQICADIIAECIEKFICNFYFN